MLRSVCNLRWIQLGDAVSAGQIELLRQWQRDSIWDALVDGNECVEPNLFIITLGDTNQHSNTMVLQHYSMLTYARRTPPLNTLISSK